MTCPLPFPLEDYSVNPTTGFLPSTAPSLRFDDVEYYRPWESIMDNYQGLLLAGRLRKRIQELPVLDTDRLAHIANAESARAQQRRAFLILCMLGHGYVWGNASEKAREHIPASIAVPWMNVSDDLGVCPVVCHAAVVLWNWRTLDNPADLSLDNLATMFTFTGATDESWFYLVTTAIEAVGAPALPALLAAITAASKRQSEDLSDSYFDSQNADEADRNVIKALRKVEDTIANVNTTLKRMYDHCDPSFFYWRIRPHLAGWENMAVAGLPNGVHYETMAEYEIRSAKGWELSAYCDGRMEKVLREPVRFLKFAGGSAGQSSLIQALDIALGVEHRATGARKETALEKKERRGSSPGLDGFRLPGPTIFQTLTPPDNVYNTRASFANDFITERIVHGDTYGSPLVRPTQITSARLAPVQEEPISDEAVDSDSSNTTSSGPSTPCDSPIDLNSKGDSVAPPPGASKVATDPKEKPNNFINTMRSYMPRPHRLFLEDLARIANIRSYVISRAVEAVETRVHIDTAKELLRQYNAVLYQLKLFRDIHIKIVTLYIVLQARKGPSVTSGSHGIARRFSEAREDREKVVSPAAPVAPAMQSVSVIKDGQKAQMVEADGISEELEDLDLDGLPGAYPAVRPAKTDYFGESAVTENGAPGPVARGITTPGGTILYPQRVLSSATGDSSSAELARKISQDDKDILRGTGGTDLSRFLAQARDETQETCAPDVWTGFDLGADNLEPGDLRLELANELIEERRKTKERNRQRNLHMARQWAEGICCGT